MQARQEVVEHRIEVLEEVLASCKFDGERINVQCAIDGYKNGAIPYSERYTVVWAGKIVCHAMIQKPSTVSCPIGKIELILLHRSIQQKRMPNSP